MFGGLAGGDQLICGVDESATGLVGEGNPVGVDLAQGDPRRRGSAFPVVDGPLGVDQPPAVVFASQTRSHTSPKPRRNPSYRNARDSAGHLLIRPQQADLPRHARQPVDKPRGWIIAATCP
jgi:hypothetical protein